MAVQSDRIHNALYSTLAGFAFPRISWDKETGLQTTDEASTETAQTVLVRPITTAFEGAEAFRRRPRVRERTTWTWEARLSFDNQVNLELFEETDPLFLPRTVDLDQQVIITLDSVDYTHPPEQSSSSGTRATLTFTASLSRK